MVLLSTHIMFWFRKKKITSVVNTLLKINYVLLSQLSEYPCEYEKFEIRDIIAENDAIGQGKFDTL